MKITKHISIFLAILLLVSNVGLAFNVHYCGGNIASVSLENFSKNNKSEIDCCGKEIKKSACCNDKKIKIEKKSDNSIVKTFSFEAQQPFNIIQWKSIKVVDFSSFRNNQTLHFWCDANAPPLYKLYSQLIFYA